VRQPDPHTTERQPSGARLPASNDACLDEVARLFERFPTEPERVLARVAELYAADLEFRDPLQALRGRDAFIAMNRKLLRTMREMRFEVGARAVRGDDGFMAWTMTVAPRLGPRMQVDGTTHLRFRDGLVVAHRDHWDLLGGAMSSLPIVRAIYPRLVRHLA
jgi:hypothetical protein